MPLTDPHFTSEPVPPEPSLPTQVAHPTRTSWRTALQSAIGALLTLGVVLPIVVSIVNEGLGQYLPDYWEVWLVGAAAAVSALSATVARIMAIPAVDAWLAKHGIGARPVEKG